VSQNTVCDDVHHCNALLSAYRSAMRGYW